MAKTWKQLKNEVFTPKELIEHEFKIELITAIIQARHDQDISQRELTHLRHFALQPSNIMS